VKNKRISACFMACGAAAFGANDHENGPLAMLFWCARNIIQFARHMPEQSPPEYALRQIEYGSKWRLC
jgi:hypothetical protein